jgi:hypothetical protein
MKSWIIYTTEDDYRNGTGYNFYGTEAEAEALESYLFESEKY